MIRIKMALKRLFNGEQENNKQQITNRKQKTENRKEKIEKDFNYWQISKQLCCLSKKLGRKLFNKHVRQIMNKKKHGGRIESGKSSKNATNCWLVDKIKGDKRRKVLFAFPLPTNCRADRRIICDIRELC